MNKSDLISAMAEKTGQTKAATEATLNALTDVIQETLTSGDTVQLLGFGTFSAEDRPARTGRNPATGKELNIPATKAVKFKVGAKLKAAVAGS